MGTCIANEDEQVNKTRKTKRVLFTGDGGFMASGLSDLETIQKLNLKCTIVIINNNAPGFVKFGQKMLYKNRVYDT